jgi:hypothetical protein
VNAVAKVNQINEICYAIAEAREILASSSFQAPLLKQRLEKEEKRLMDELYEAVRKKALASKRNKAITKQLKTDPQSLIKGGKNDNG